MMQQRWAHHLQRTHERWRDPILTAMTAVLALMMFVVVPIQVAAAIETPIFRIGVTLLLTGGLLVVSRSIIPIIAMAVVAALAVASLLLQLHQKHPELHLYFQALSWLLIGLTTVWVVARAVFGPGSVNYHRIIGAVLLYLAIGLVFVALFTFIGLADPKAFSGLSVGDRTSLLSELIYFSFVTLTTVGFGDIVPVNPLARGLCNIEAIFGQLYPATLLARLVTLEAATRS